MNTFPGGGWIAISLIFLIIIIAVFAPSSTLSYIDFWDDSVSVSQRSGINLVSGDNITVSAVDDPANNRVNYNIGTKPGTANQILVTDSGGTSTEFSSDISPGSVTVDNLIVNSNLINTDSDLDWSLQNNGNTMLTLQDSGSEGNNNIYMSQDKFSGSGRTQVSAFDGQVAASSDQVIFTADELMSASNKYTTGLVQLISKHDTAGNKWNSYLLFISGRSVSGSNSVTTVTSQTVSGGCPLSFSFDATTFDFIASNASATNCDVGATFVGLGAWQD